MSKNFNCYFNVVTRLIQYRNHLNLTQEEMGKLLDVTQSHYSKLENNLKVISQSSLLHFYHSGHDVLWILTGQRYYEGKFDLYCQHCSTVSAKVNFLEGCVWIISQGLRISHSQIQISELEQSIHLLNYNQLRNNVWQSIREIENLTQVQLADLLEINIKRYRRLEKGEVKPDAAVLSLLYNNLGYSPMFILEQDSYCIGALNSIWDSFEQELQIYLNEYIEKVFELVNR